MVLFDNTFTRYIVTSIRDLGKARGPGAWIFKHHRVSWMYEPDLKRQLPLPYWIFATFCQLQMGVNKRTKIRFGKTAFILASGVTRFFSLSDHVCLDLPTGAVYLDLLDPRFIQVVNELHNDYIASLLHNFLSPGDTFVDVGANHGGYSIKAAQVVGPMGLVVAAEPQPRLAKFLEMSLSTNSRCKYQVLQIAFGDRNDEVEFYIPAGTSGSAGVFPQFSARTRHHSTSVTVKRFDEAVDWSKFPGSVFLKVDIEGSEHDFLKGAQAMIIARQPILMLEVNPTTLRAVNVSVQDLTYLLMSLGYTFFIELDNLANFIPLQDLDAQRERNIIVLPQRMVDKQSC